MSLYSRSAIILAVRFRYNCGKAVLDLKEEERKKTHSGKSPAEIAGIDTA
jgi:hypothetical protein